MHLRERSSGDAVLMGSSQQLSGTLSECRALSGLKS